MDRFLLSAFFLVVCLSPAFAAGTAPGSLRELIVLGLERNIGLQVEKVNIPISAAGVEAETADFDSELFATASYAEQSIMQSVSVDKNNNEQVSGLVGIRKKYTGGLTASLGLQADKVSGNNPLESLNPGYQTTLLLDLTQPLLRNFGVSINTTELQIRQNEQKQAAYQYFQQAQQVALQIETLALLSAGQAEIVRLRREAVDLARDLLNANQRRYDSGVIPVSEVQEAETDLANRELNLSLALQALELTRESLNRQLDYQLSEDFTAESLYPLANTVDPALTTDLPEFKIMFSEARQKRLDLKIGSLSVANRQLQKSFLENQQLPQLDLKFQAGVSGLSGRQREGAAVSPWTGSFADSFDSLAGADGNQWQAGLEFSVPLGNRLAKSRFAQSDLLERQAGYHLHNLESGLRDELLQQRTLLQRTAEQFELAVRFQALAEKSFRQELRRLEEGLSDTFRIILFQNNMINAKIDRITALTQYHQAVAKMNYTRGIILEKHGITVATADQEVNFERL